MPLNRIRKDFFLSPVGEIIPRLRADFPGIFKGEIYGSF